MDSIDLAFIENENQLNSTDQSQEIILHKSFHDINDTEYTWKPSTLGIKCISEKPKGHIFLTRRILDLCSTDGKRKIEIEYNYTKDYKNKQEFKSKGSSIQNCSFCDTVSLDFEPESTYFDLLMDVQIITVVPANSGSSVMNKIENCLKPELVSYTDTGQKLELNNDDEETQIFSSYNLKYSKQELNSNDNKLSQSTENQLKGIFLHKFYKN